LDSYITIDISNADLDFLSTVPLLFNSGYLTIDKVTNYPLTSPWCNYTELVNSYGFKFPNFEVYSSYFKDCFKVIFDLDSDEALDQKANELRKALLDRDAETVSSIFSNFLATISYAQRLKESSFQEIIKIILEAMGFKIISELTDSQVRLDLCIEMPEKLFIIIEIKNCPKLANHPKNEENLILTSFFINSFPKEEFNRVLAFEARKKISPIDYFKLSSSTVTKDITEKNRVLAEAYMNFLPADQLNNTLAKLARAKLTEAEIEVILEKADVISNKSDKTIDALLYKAADEALRSITEKDYHRLLNNYASNYIDLGLAIYGSGSIVKVAFGPKEHGPNVAV
jgi:hypothetical protein